MTERGEILYRTTYALNPRNMGAADLETDGLGGEVIMGAVRHWDGKYATFTDTRSMLAAMIDTPLAATKTNHSRHSSGIIWFHNFAGFDGGRFVTDLLDLLLERPEIDAAIIPQGQSKFIALILSIPQPHEDKRYRVTLADSMAVHPVSLDALTAAMAPSLRKMNKCPDHDFTAGGVFSAECEWCRDYLQRDVDGLLESMTATEQQCFTVFNCPIAITAGAIAVKAAKTMIPRGHVYFRNPKDVETFCRRAVHGGLVWPGFKRGDRGPTVGLDTSGAYGAQTKAGLPAGPRTRRRIYDPDLPGVWLATVDVPRDTPIPILCGPDDGPALPTGTWTGVFTSIELNYAEKIGCGFTPHWGYTWERYEYPFNEFIDKCESLEYPADGSAPDPATKAIVKLCRNGLAGKFATRAEIIKWRLGVVPEEGEIPYVNEETGEQLPLMGKLAKLEGASYIHPEWNAFITARQRIKIHQELMAAGEGAQYADTDGKYLSPAAAEYVQLTGAVRIGIGYGLDHVEAVGTRLIVAGPKVKVWYDGDGKPHTTAKGIPKRQRDPASIAAASAGRAVEIKYESVHSLRAQLRAPHKPYAEVRRRCFSVLEKSKSWRVDSDDNIRPVHINRAPEFEPWPPER